ncbi:ADP-ribosylation factor-like protein 2 [Pleodorina starrii]|uniref:ADP-ribosylation factor-like protein 2 n=1 Tax=Pleodorina starrii TaxID=330485 RepID=A0A9W6BQL6_9CHLO|nr:ADP-ribosylation factor-like protein 2 [Pleodorina starrii]
MGLLNLLVRFKPKEKEVRVLMVGLENAGKTTIVKRLNGEDITTVSPTLGFNVITMKHRGYKFTIWDIGGQKLLRRYWQNYYDNTDVLIWVVDASDYSRLKTCREELHKLLKEE